MKYWKTEIGVGTFAFVRHYTEEEALQVFELYKAVHPIRGNGELTQVFRWKGWYAFFGIPSDHEIVWQEADSDAELHRYSTSRSKLIIQKLCAQHSVDD